jgi:hypothetical protein
MNLRRALAWFSPLGSVATLVIMTLGATPAFAQGDLAPRALAQKLFDEGRALMQQNRFDQACPMLAESHRLDPMGGTVLNLALCYEKQGKTATAWVTFEEARALARRDGNPKRVDFATRHIASLGPRLSHLQVRVDDSVEGLAVRLDGHLLSPTLWGTEVPVDPGTHRIEASAPNRSPWSDEIVIRADAERITVAVPALTRASDPETPAPLRSTPLSQPPRPASEPASEPAATPTIDTSSTAAGSSGTASLGYVLGGVGLVSVGVGSYFGLRALSSWNERNDHCDATGCDPTGLNAGEETSDRATVANVGFGVGLVAIAAGAYLVLSDDGEQPRTTATARIEPEVEAHGAGISLRGSW